jgi:DNA-binding NtrC family response regulator
MQINAKSQRFLVDFEDGLSSAVDKISEINHPSNISLNVWIIELEMAIIKKALELQNYHVADVARTLGIQRTTLHEKMKRLGLSRKELKGE